MVAGPSDQVRMVMFRDRRKQRRPDVRPGGVAQQPRRFEGAGATDDASASGRAIRIGRGRGDPRLIERHTVTDRHLA